MYTINLVFKISFFTVISVVFITSLFLYHENNIDNSKSNELQHVYSQQAHPLKENLSSIEYYEVSLVSDMVNITTTWISKYGYAGIFSAALLENVFPPIPSELIFPLAGFTANSKKLGMMEGVIGMAAAGAAGSTAGAVMIYYVSRRIGRQATLKFGKYVGIGETDLQKTEKWFEKHGQAAVFFGRMAPGVRELISIPAGIQKMKISIFVIFTFAGSLIWSIALTLVGFYVGEAWNIFYEEYSFVFDIIAIIIIAGIMLWIILRHFKRGKKKRSNNKGTAS